MVQKLLFPAWIVAAIALFFYSFTQVDLSLTLSQASIFQDIQKAFQYVGWFNRPLSTYLYIFLLVVLCALYLLTLWSVLKQKISAKTVWMSIITVGILVFPSYNAFSYDLFNYIFDARIVSFYGLNPYEYKPLDFADDPMLSFMRSTHRVYPYGPSWLGITVPLAFIGSEIFIATFFLFKLLALGCYLVTAYFIGKIATREKLGNPLLAVAFFALNPLVLIEGLVSAHNEIVMMCLMTMSLFFLLRKKVVLSGALFFLSVGIKYATAILVPIFFIKLFFKNVTNKQVILMAVVLMIGAIVATSLASGLNKEPEFQPWYLLLAMPFISLYENRFVRIVFLYLSVGALLSYIPFLYTGEWPGEIVMIKNAILAISIVAGCIGFITYKTITKR